jgi:hypothetical protein
MQMPESDLRSDPGLPDIMYRQIRDQTAAGSGAGPAGTVACIAFVIAALVLVVLLEAGADLQQLLLAAGALAAVNLVAGVVWVTAGQRSS